MVGRQLMLIKLNLRDYGLYDAGIEPIRAAEAVKNARVLTQLKKAKVMHFIVTSHMQFGEWQM